MACGRESQYTHTHWAKGRSTGHLQTLAPSAELALCGFLCCHASDVRRPVFVFDEDGWLSVLDEGLSTGYLELVDVERGEYVAFDIDGQVLDITQNLETPDLFDFCATGEYDVEALLLLVRRAAELSNYSPRTDDPLLEMANWGLTPRPRGWLGRVMRRPPRPTPEFYSR